MWLIHTAMRRPITVLMVIAGVALTSILALQRMRADIFPEPYLTAIGTLQDQAPPAPTDQIIAVIERELGRPVGEVFDEFEREPAAAASLASRSPTRLAAKVLSD